MISGVFAFVMLLGMLLPWLFKLYRRFTLNLVGSISAIVSVYFIWLGINYTQFSEQIGSGVVSMGISLAFGTQEIVWLVATLLLITLHFIIYHRQFRELSLTSLVLYLFSIFAVCGILLSRDLFNLFVMIEVFSVSMIGLILLRTNHLSALKAFQYLLMNSLAAAMFLLGVVLIYRQTGLLNLDMLLELFSEQGVPNRAMAFMMTALSLKLMLFPFAAWAKNLIGERGGVAAAYVTMLMPMVFVFDLQKLSGLMKSTHVLFLSLLASITLFIYLVQWFWVRKTWRADLVFVLNSVFVLVFAVHFYLDRYYLLLAYGVLSSVLKMLLLRRREEFESEELVARGCELSINYSVLALLLVFIIYFII
jgi:NADH:ubiquinone oxidoreductase subunit 2 (subunit N)